MSFVDKCWLCRPSLFQVLVSLANPGYVESLKHGEPSDLYLQNFGKVVKKLFVRLFLSKFVTLREQGHVQ